jgi:hypothetical protein
LLDNSSRQEHLSDLPGGVEQLERVSEIGDLNKLKDLPTNLIGGRWRAYDLLLQLIAE